MAGKDFNDGYDDPGYDEPEFDDTEFDESDYEDSEYDELLLDQEEDSERIPTEEGEELAYEEYDEGLLPEDGDDGFMYDEEGNSELQPKVYYYKDEENYEEDMLYEEPEDDGEVTKKKKKMSLLKKILLGVGIFLGVVIIFLVFTFFTPAGRNFWYWIAGEYVRDGVITIDEEAEEKANKIISELVPQESGVFGIVDDKGNLIRPDGPRSEDYVKTYLLFGIEEIGGAANTDAILLVSINKKDNTIKLTSIMRDTYVNIPGNNPNKINSVYSRGTKMTDDPKAKKATGALLLKTVIENTFDVAISGYACVNFSSFEKIVDRLGGIDIELGEKEAAYLRKTNYISNPANRTVKAGWNHMNGNQVLGYCRVRKVVTLGGANNDYGRTVRHRRVINAIIAKFKSVSYLDMLPIMTDVLAEITTNIREDQISDTLRDVVENSIFSTNSMRLPADEFFTDSGKKGIYNGSSNITYTLVMGDQLGKNIEKLHQFIFLDKEGETDTTGMVGAGAGAQSKSGSSSGSSSSGSSSSKTPTPTVTSETSLIDEAIPSSQQLGAGAPAGPAGIPGLVPEGSLVSTEGAIELAPSEQTPSEQTPSEGQNPYEQTPSETVVADPSETVTVPVIDDTYPDE